MPIVTADLKKSAELVKFRIEGHLKPAESKAILAHITIMLRHYFFDGQIPPEIMHGLGLQWLKVLQEFPEWAIEQAVTEYLSNDSKGRKPVPGQIKFLADKAIIKYKALITQCDRVSKAKIDEPDDMTEEQKAKMRHRVSIMIGDLVRSMKYGQTDV